MRNIKEKNEIWLNSDICSEFRKIINSSNVFIYDKQLKQYWNLICVVMDRLDSAIIYLNKYTKHRPKTDDELITFMAYACLIVDAIKDLFKEIKIPFIPQTTYFHSTFTELKCKRIYNITGNFPCSRDHNYSSKNCKTNNCPLENESKNDYPSDDNFFYYLRSMMFAHPYETSRPKFLLKDEINYSPFVFTNQHFGGDNISNPVGLNIYSNKFNWTLHLFFSFDTLKDYIKSRYNLLVNAISWAEQHIENENKKWAQRKVNRALLPLDILKDIKSILKERHIETYQEDLAIELLECPITLKENINSIIKYKNYLESCIFSRCDEVDDFNNDNQYPADFDKALNPRPNKTYPMFDYEIGKIYSYLSNNNTRVDDVQYGRKMTKLFAQQFAKDYVKIDYENMSISEIKLLINTACYLEKLNQENGIINSSILEAIDEQKRHIENNYTTSKRIIKLPNGEKAVFNVLNPKKKNQK